MIKDAIFIILRHLCISSGNRRTMSDPSQSRHRPDMGASVLRAVFAWLVNLRYPGGNPGRGQRSGHRPRDSLHHGRNLNRNTWTTNTPPASEALCQQRFAELNPVSNEKEPLTE